MKFRELVEQVTSGNVAPHIIPGGFLSMIRRPQFAKSGNYFISFKKEKKDKERSKGVIYFAKAKKPEWIWEEKKESFEYWEARDVVEEAYISTYGEVPDGPGFDEAIDRVLRGAKSKEEAEKIVYGILDDIDETGLHFTWDDEPKPIGIKASEERTKEIKKSAKKLPMKKLKLKIKK